MVSIIPIPVGITFAIVQIPNPPAREIDEPKRAIHPPPTELKVRQMPDFLYFRGGVEIK
jgi:hypothetical protein